MEAIGSEVGQKMRSAIKAKLMELGCYVDDELPDYVMVMVANKRTRSQMEDDLQLFLTSNTEAFVGWLHQVLQKLQEVTINTSFVTTSSTKKSKNKHSSSGSDLKKERKEKDKKKEKERSKLKQKSKAKEKKAKKEKVKKSSVKESESIRPNVPPLYMNLEKESSPSITDIFAGQILKTHGIKNNISSTASLETSSQVSQSTEIQDKLSRKVLNRNRFPIIDPNTVSQIMQPIKETSVLSKSRVDSFDIPSIADIEKERDMLAALPREEQIKEFNEINAKIQTLKKKLAEQLESGSEDEDFINLRTEAEELMGVDFNEEVSLPTTQPVQEAKTPPLVKTPPPVISEPVEKSLSPPKLTPRIREPIKAPEKSPTKAPEKSPTRPELPQIELNLPKRPMRERLGVKPNTVSTSGETIITRTVNMVNPYQSNKTRNENDEEHLDRSHADKLVKSSTDKVSIKSRLSIRDDGNKGKARQKEFSTQKDEVPKRRIGSRVVPLSHERQDEQEHNVVAVASVVRAPPRPTGSTGGPASQLLLRAVADAHKSLLTMPPKNNLETPKKKALVLPMRRDVNPKKIIIEVASDKIPTPNDSRDDNSDYEIDMDTESLGDLESDGDNRKISNEANTEYVPEPLGKKSLNFKGVDYVPTHINERKKDNNEKIQFPVVSRILHLKTEKDSQCKKDPQFVVTLEGVDPNMFLEKKLGREIEADKEKSVTSKKSEISNIEEDKILEKKSLEIKLKTECKGSETENSKIKNNPMHRTNIKISFDKVDEKNKQKTDSLIEVICKSKENTDNKILETKSKSSDTSFQVESSKVGTKRKSDTNIEDKVSGKKSVSPIIFNSSDPSSPKNNSEHADTSKSKYNSVPSLPPDKKRKTSVSLNLREARCRFFPDCRLGSACEFYHPPITPSPITPSAACRSFPNCAFGDNCAYGHPLCKFDISCTRKGCPYTHTVPLHNKIKLVNQPLSTISPVVASRVVPAQNYKSISAAPLPPICKFYPNCSNPGCHFFHPKPCRFGKFCLNKIECNFYHHDTPSSSSLKWTG